jgi:hypothetical protein
MLVFRTLSPPVRNQISIGHNTTVVRLVVVCATSKTDRPTKVNSSDPNELVSRR